MFEQQAAPWDRVIVLANRAPFRHELAADGRVTQKRSGSGVVTALEPFVESCGGTWIAHGCGSADRRVADQRDGVDVPPSDPKYRLRYVWLEKPLVRGFYDGFSNELLWPLCHDVGIPAVFRADDFRMYEIANARFASAVVHEARFGSPLVLVQDYHFALAPALIRRFMPASAIAAFWHIPWPTPGVFRTCPFAEDLLAGLLGSNVLGMQTEEDCANFLGSAEALHGASVDRLGHTVRYRGRVTRVRACPVGVERRHPALAAMPRIEDCRVKVREQLRLSSDVVLGIGVDRLDYTKGLNHKFVAIERLLELRPEMRGRFVFVQVAEPSRDGLAAYRAARAQLADTAARINGRFGAPSYRPIHLLEAHHDADAVYGLYRAADVCVVSSLRDGMNLVAKEFVSARDDERGVLVLSRFAGAAQQLRAALLCNPWNIETTAQTIARALAMSVPEQTMRMRLLRANVRTFDAAWWARQLVAGVVAAGADDAGVALVAAGMGRR